MSLSCTLIISSVFPGTPVCNFALQGSQLVMYGWLVRSLRLRSVCLRTQGLTCWVVTWMLQIGVGLRRLSWWLLSCSPSGFFKGVVGLFVPCSSQEAMHGVEASSLSQGSLLRRSSAIVAPVWSRKQPVAHGSTVLSLLDGTDGCDPSFCIVWFRLRLMRRYLAYHSEQSHRVYRIMAVPVKGARGMGLFICCWRVLLRLGLRGIPMFLVGPVLGCLV